MNHESLLFEHLVEALRLVATDYECQKEILPQFVYIPDEIALIYANNGQAFVQQPGNYLQCSAVPKKSLRSNPWAYPMFNLMVGRSVLYKL